MLSWNPPPRLDEYRLLRPLGRGQMGQVFLARDHLLARSVAIKFLGKFAPGTPAHGRFLTEARAAARLQHPNVVSVYRIGELDGRPYIVSEYVRGQSLDRVERPMPWSRVLDLAIGLARGLAAAHRRGVLHRDLKPANAILTEDGTPKLLDFGLAKVHSPRSSTGSLGAGPQNSSLGFGSDSDSADMLGLITGELHVDGGAGDAAVLALLEEMAVQGSPASSISMQLPVLSDRGLGELGPLRPALPSDDLDPSALMAPPSDDLGAPPVSVYDPIDPSSLLAPPSDDLAPLPSAGPRATRVGTLLGTPDYMAPELWRAEPATPASDVYAFGAMLFELLTGKAPTEQWTLAERAQRLQLEALPSVRAQVVDLPSAFADLIDRCLERRPELRFRDGEALRGALEELARGATRRPALEGDPFVGLRPFAAEDAGRFFGRDEEASLIYERLRGEGLILIAGEPGVGKTSLMRAGVLSRVMASGLGDEREWTVVDASSRARPATALAMALAPRLGLSDESATRLMSASVDDFLVGLRRAIGERSGVVWVLDGLEEPLSRAEPDEVELIDELFARFSREPGLRVVATVRADAIARLVELPHMGRELWRSLVVLRSLSGPCLREAILEPLQGTGVSFETDALVSELVSATHGVKNGLGLLQFALQSLWERRERKLGCITEASLRSLGGVAGAYVAHADRVVGRFSLEARGWASTLLVSLVSPDGRPIFLDEAELPGGPEAEDARRDVTRMLVDAHLVARVQHADRSWLTLAHEILVTHWATLRDWVESERRGRARATRLEQAAQRWVSEGRSRRGLLAGPELDSLGPLDAGPISGDAAALLVASRRSRRWRAFRRSRWTWGTVSAALLLCALFGVLSARATRRDIAREHEEGRARLAEAQALEAAADVAHAGPAQDPGEQRRLLGLADQAYREAALRFERGVLLGARSEEGPSLSGILDRRAQLRTRLGDAELAAELRARSAIHRAGR